MAPSAGQQRELLGSRADICVRVRRAAPYLPSRCFLQELSTLMRYAVNPIIILSNNGSYTIESEIHDGWVGCPLLFT